MGKLEVIIRPNSAELEFKFDQVEPVLKVIDFDGKNIASNKDLNIEIDKIQKDIDKLESNLNNSNFLDRAPENIVNDIKSRLLLNLDKKDKLEDSINRLNY